MNLHSPTASCPWPPEETGPYHGGQVAADNNCRWCQPTCTDGRHGPGTSAGWSDIVQSVQHGRPSCPATE